MSIALCTLGVLSRTGGDNSLQGVDDLRSGDVREAFSVMSRHSVYHFVEAIAFL